MDLAATLVHFQTPIAFTNFAAATFNYSSLCTAICIQAQTANIFARFFTFETGRLPLETEKYSPLM
jgi:hypothetical protein